MMARSADKLGHGSHRTVDAPASGLKESHGNQAEDRGSQHNAVKAKGKLGCSRVEDGSVIGPVPGKLKGP